MNTFLNTPFTLNTLPLANRLIQGPLAGYSCAPFRALFSLFSPPAYCVSEMLSAHDVLEKHQVHDRYLFRAKEEKLLCYQIAGTDPALMAAASQKLEALGANLIDINCGCPKLKIRKKGAGSALLEAPERLFKLITTVRLAIKIPLTVKIRLQVNHQHDIDVAKKIVDAGADALIIHGRRWYDSYETPCDLKQIALIKKSISIPVIVNGDLTDNQTITTAFNDTGCDAFMISRAGCGRPSLFQEIATNTMINFDKNQLIELFMLHLNGLAKLENDYKAVLQSRSLVRYYFKNLASSHFLSTFYQLTTLTEIERSLNDNFFELDFFTNCP